jgi:hypothetical protein
MMRLKYCFILSACVVSVSDVMCNSKKKESKVYDRLNLLQYVFKDISLVELPCI